MYMNVFSVFFCFLTLRKLHVSSFFYKKYCRTSIANPLQLVIDRNIFQNSDHGSDPDAKNQKPNEEHVNEFLNPTSEYANFIQNSRNKHVLDGCDHTWQKKSEAYENEEIHQLAENHKKLSIVKTLENVNVSEITKLSLIHDYPEMFHGSKYDGSGSTISSLDDRRRALYIGFEEFMN